MISHIFLMVRKMYHNILKKHCINYRNSILYHINQIYQDYLFENRYLTHLLFLSNLMNSVPIHEQIYISKQTTPSTLKFKKFFFIYSYIIGLIIYIWKKYILKFFSPQIILILYKKRLSVTDIDISYIINDYNQIFKIYT